MKQVSIIGAGLAGSEACWQLVKRGISVRLIEMRPKVQSPAHHSELFGELVCSNSLRSNALSNAVGILKEEMRHLDSLILRCGDATQVPAGSALAVDREQFSQMITQTLCNHPLVHVVHEEMDHIPQQQPLIIASGPLTSPALAKAIQEETQLAPFHFYDAAAPIIEKDSIDFSKAYMKSRYDKGEASYINCPMNKAEFDRFYEELLHAECVELHDFEEKSYFEGCMPFEEMARRGKQTLLFGPMKPVGLETSDGKTPYAVVQLRQDNAIATLYNIVGFQTHLKWGEQKRILSLIPGLENVSIVRYGVMHRNSYICSPRILKSSYQSKMRDDLFFAGQLCGVEGYVESASSGLLAGINMARYLQGKSVVTLDDTCAMGALANYITKANATNFQPMHANFGIMRLLTKVKKKDRKLAFGKQALRVIDAYKQEIA